MRHRWKGVENMHATWVEGMREASAEKIHSLGSRLQVERPIGYFPRLPERSSQRLGTREGQGFPNSLMLLVVWGACRDVVETARVSSSRPHSIYAQVQDASR